MIFVLLQGLFLLIVLNVLFMRYVRRRSEDTKQALSTEEAELATIDRRIVEAHHAVRVAQNRLTALGDNVQTAEAAVASAQKELATVREAPIERYYVFDRMEPRIGVIWEARVRLLPDPMTDRRLLEAWKADRVYLIVAGSHSEAEERMQQRFSRASGFEVYNIVPCPLFVRPRGADDAMAGAESVSERKRA